MSPSSSRSRSTSDKTAQTSYPPRYAERGTNSIPSLSATSAPSACRRNRKTPISRKPAFVLDVYFLPHQFRRLILSRLVDGGLRFCLARFQHQHGLVRPAPVRQKIFIRLRIHKHVVEHRVIHLHVVPVAHIQPAAQVHPLPVILRELQLSVRRILRHIRRCRAALIRRNQRHSQNQERQAHAAKSQTLSHNASLRNHHGLSFWTLECS